jgi:hypothetical protein
VLRLCLTTRQSKRRSVSGSAQGFGRRDHGTIYALRCPASETLRNFRPSTAGCVTTAHLVGHHPLQGTRCVSRRQRQATETDCLIAERRAPASMTRHSERAKPTRLVNSRSPPILAARSLRERSPRRRAPNSKRRARDRRRTRWRLGSPSTIRGGCRGRRQGKYRQADGDDAKKLTTSTGAAEASIETVSETEAARRSDCGRQTKVSDGDEHDTGREYGHGREAPQYASSTPESQRQPARRGSLKRRIQQTQST